MEIVDQGWVSFGASHAIQSAYPVTALACLIEDARQVRQRLGAKRLMENLERAYADDIKIRLADEKLPPPALDDVVAEVRKSYHGPLAVREDLMSFEIGETVTVKRLMPGA